MIASVENMQRAYDQGYRNGSHQRKPLSAFSPTTGEEYSADPGDYWNAPPGYVMKDENGDPMILASRSVCIEELEL